MSSAMRLFTVAACASLLSCGGDRRAQVIATVDGEPGVRAMAASLEITVAGGGQLDEEVFSLTTRRDDPAGLAWGTEVAIAPRGEDSARRFRIDATARDAAGAVVATTYAISGFVEGEVRVLRLVLTDGCIGATCSDERACRDDGACVEPFIPPDLLPPYVADAGMPDAGVDGGSDGAVDARGPVDSGRDAASDGGTDAGDAGPLPECTMDSECPVAEECASVSCIAGECFYDTRDAACDDGNVCTRNRCDPVEGCRAETVGGPCDDGQFCNGADTCDAGVCTPSGINPCSGGSPRCNEDRDLCGCATTSNCTMGRECIDLECICPGGSTESACSGGTDDDCDGLIDCGDPDCGGRGCGANGLECAGGSCVCPGDVEVCMNDADDDCDGMIDCADGDCGGQLCGPLGERCSGGVCQCPSTTENCNNGIDDDCDGMVDCADPGCRNLSCGTMGQRCIESICQCPAAVETCGNSMDDDCDGATDEGCMTDPEMCHNGIDDDMDGLTDCEDFLDCFMGAPCGGGGMCQRRECCIPSGPETCDGSTDEDCDGIVDEVCT